MFFAVLCVCVRAVIRNVLVTRWGVVSVLMVMMLCESGKRQQCQWKCQNTDCHRIHHVIIVYQRTAAHTHTERKEQQGIEDSTCRCENYAPSTLEMDEGKSANVRERKRKGEMEKKRINSSSFVKPFVKNYAPQMLIIQYYTNEWMNGRLAKARVSVAGGSVVVSLYYINTNAKRNTVRCAHVVNSMAQININKTRRFYLSLKSGIRTFEQYSSPNWDV